jgi:Phage tail assembly chaperone proteins, E, or 41 or 14
MSTVLKLSKPTKINGSEIEEITLELENLRGKDLMELESGFRKFYRGEFVAALNLDSRYQLWVAGRACNLNPEDLAELYAPDFVALTGEVQSFLLSAG